MELLLILVIPYFIGSIPFGLILTRFWGYGDIRAIGSGNIGATNVMRTGNKGLALLTLLLDGLKGYLPALYIFNSGWGFTYRYCEKFITTFEGMHNDPDGGMLYLVHLNAAVSLLLIIGHIFPVWLKFKGGKGVATAIGVIAALNPLLALLLITIWLIVFSITRISSLSALTGLLLTTLFSLTSVSGITAIGCNTRELYFEMMLAITLILFFTHRENIKRLLNGTEHKWSKK